MRREYEDQPIPDKAQKSFGDHDALPMAKKGEGFMYGYNCQAAVDGDHQIIVAADLHDAPNDFGALKPMVDQISENCEKAAEGILVDSGYRSAKNIAAIEEAGSTPYVALAKGEEIADKDVRNSLKVSKKDDKLVYQ